MKAERKTSVAERLRSRCLACVDSRRRTFGPVAAMTGLGEIRPPNKEV
jgi:hypothetical protein